MWAPPSTFLVRSLVKGEPAAIYLCRRSHAQIGVWKYALGVSLNLPLRRTPRPQPTTTHGAHEPNQDLSRRANSDRSAPPNVRLSAIACGAQPVPLTNR